MSTPTRRAALAAAAALALLIVSAYVQPPLDLFLSLAGSAVLLYCFVQLRKDVATYGPKHAFRIKIGFALLVLAFICSKAALKLVTLPDVTADQYRFAIGLDGASDVLLTFVVLMFFFVASKGWPRVVFGIGVGSALLAAWGSVSSFNDLLAGKLSQQAYQNSIGPLALMAYAPSIIACLGVASRLAPKAPVSALDAAIVMAAKTPLPPPPSTPAAPSQNELVTMLEHRLARGEISEQTYLEIRKRHQS